MKRANIGRRSPGRPCGFTLVELLLVMSIIIMLVGLLIPAVNAAVMAVRGAASENTIHQLEAALETFRQDWGMYPPSKIGKDGWDQRPGDGYYALLYYLVGPEGRGWGSLSASKIGPFGGTASAPYGPYYKTSDPGTGGLSPIPDAFKPPKYIFYYRCEPADGDSAYDFSNNNANNADSTIGSFIGRAYFELLVKPKDPVSGTWRWVRQDYLLISAGADRFWGYVKELRSSGAGAASLTQDVTENDVTSGVAMCDDICNFKH